MFVSLSPMSSTNQLASAFSWDSSSLALTPGPSWPTWEKFRQAGATGLESIPKHGVATLQTKKGTFRIMHDDDFQRLLGIASSVHRLQKGLKVILQSANLVYKHPDQDHIRLLVEHASMFAESPVLPERDGHELFKLTPEETAEQSTEDLDFDVADIPRPKW